MRVASFSLIVDKINDSFTYRCGFKSASDAAKFAELYGGVVENIECVFYDSISDAVGHQTTIREAIDTIKDAIASKDPEILEILKELKI